MACCEGGGAIDAALHCSPCSEVALSAGPLIDSHCHINLDPLLTRHEIVIFEALKANINGFCVNGVSLGDDWSSVQMLHEKFPDFIIPSYGLHPHNIQEYRQLEETVSWEKLLEQKLTINEIAGVGECGLDKLIKKDIPLDCQVDVLQKHLRIAKRFSRVMIINRSITCLFLYSLPYSAYLCSLCASLGYFIRCATAL